jgi:hypothetical protein
MVYGLTIAVYQPAEQDIITYGLWSDHRPVTSLLSETS